jgi:uridine kinase
MTRDIAERGRDPKGVIDMYLRFVKPSFDTWVDPVRRHADVVIPNMGSEVSKAAMQMLIQHIRLQLKNRQAPYDLNRVDSSISGEPSSFTHLKL